MKSGEEQKGKNVEQKGKSVDQKVKNVEQKLKNNHYSPVCMRTEYQFRSVSSQ